MYRCVQMGIILSREFEGNSGQELAEEMRQWDIGCCIDLEHLHSLGLVLDALHLLKLKSSLSL